MFETDGSAGYLPSLPPRLDRASQRSISTAAIDCVGTLPTIDCPRGVAPVRMPKADATETGSKEIGQSNPSRTHSPVREGAGISWPPFFKNKSWHFFGEVSRAEALGLNCEGRPARFCRALRIGSSLVGIPLLPTRKGILSSPSNAPST